MRLKGTLEMLDDAEAENERLQAENATLRAELDEIAKHLNDALVPREVWIGTDSTADRVKWLALRCGNFERTASALRAVPAEGDVVISEELAGFIAEAISLLNGAESCDGWKKRIADELQTALARAIGETKCE